MDSGHDSFHLGSGYSVRLFVTDIDRMFLRKHNIHMDTKTFDQIEQLKKQITGLELFVSLIKDGCQWQGDVMSKKWGECLYMVSEHSRQAVNRTLDLYEEGVDFRVEGNRDDDSKGTLAVWIAFV